MPLHTPALLLCLALAWPLQAWGDEGHRIISSLALRTLPRETRAWFEGREAEVRDHASDPDHWKQDRKEGPRHFINVEPYGGPDRVPPSLEAARARLGSDYQRAGVLPWIIQDRTRDLVAAFQGGDPSRIAFATAILGHYLADAHVPLHTTLNYDGQLSDQKGVHRRWETGLLGRAVSPEQLEVRPAQADPGILERPWAWIRSAHALVPQLLADDREALRVGSYRWGRRPSGAYWQLFSQSQGPVVRRQLEQAGQHLGDAILSAWVQAGRPRPR